MMASYDKVTRFVMLRQGVMALWLGLSILWGVVIFAMMQAIS